MNNIKFKAETIKGEIIEACCAPVLHLTLKKYWFDMIKSGIKKEEYREIKDYWVKRLFRFPEIFDCLKNSCIEC